MADYSNIKATIDAQIKQNGNEEITGPVLNSVLTQMLTALVDGKLDVDIANQILEYLTVYTVSDYQHPYWRDGTTVGGRLTAHSYTGTYSKIISVSEGDIVTITGKGGSTGRMWYTLNSNSRIVRMADANAVGTFTVTIASGEAYFVAQTNNANYIGFSVAGDSERLADIEARLNALTGGALSGKRLSILGDSISTFGVPDQDNATGTWTYPGNRCRYPQNNLFTNVNYCYWKRLLDRYGMVLGINESWAGSRVSNTQATDSGDLGPNRCISSETRIGHLGENGTPDIILVYAGTNDAGAGVTLGTFSTENPINYTDEEISALPVATFADAYRAMLIRLLKRYPTSRVIAILPNFTVSYYSITNLDRFVEVVKEACDFFGVKYIDIRTAGITVYNQGTYFPDGIHPNAAGMELLYKKVCMDGFDELDRFGL